MACFFDVPVSSSFRYPGKSQEKGESGINIMSPDPSCFLAPLPVLPSFPDATSPFQVLGTWYNNQVTQGSLGCWSHTALVAWARVKPEWFSWQSLRQGPTWGQAPKHPAQSHKLSWERGGKGLSWAEMAVRSQQWITLVGHFPLLHCLSVIHESLLG